MNTQQLSAEQIEQAAYDYDCNYVNEGHRGGGIVQQSFVAGANWAMEAHTKAPTVAEEGGEQNTEWQYWQDKYEKEKEVSSQWAKKAIEAGNQRVQLQHELTKLQAPIVEGEVYSHYHVADNSDGFRGWLKEKGIDFLPNGHFTSIPLEGNDIFKLGVEFGLYRQRMTQKRLEPLPNSKEDPAREKKKETPY